jgi:hypothetical protein
MDYQRIDLRLKRAPGDPPESDPRFQEELVEFSNSLRTAGVVFFQRARAFDADGASGYSLAEFAITTLGPAVISAVAALCGAWVQARNGRRVRIKIGDVEVEGRTIEEIESLLNRAADFRNSDNTNAAIRGKHEKI